MRVSLGASFTKYFTIGVFNTVLHWSVFFVLIKVLNLSTAWANLLAFFVAVTFSFFMNAHYTFKALPTKARYFYFVVFMAALSYGIGLLTDHLMLQPLLALIAFSLISLFLGFLYSRNIVFRNNR